MSLIQAKNLTKVYGKGDTAVTALDHINLEVNAGEFVAVRGPSGCGKSTMLVIEVLNKNHPDHSVGVVCT